MNRKDFFKAIKDLRTSISRGYTNEYKHWQLDNIVKIVIGDKEMSIDSNNIEAQTEVIVNMIKNLKAAKENEKIKARAESILKLIKDEIDKD